MFPTLIGAHTQQFMFYTYVTEFVEAVTISGFHAGLKALSHSMTCAFQRRPVLFVLDVPAVKLW